MENELFYYISASILGLFGAAALGANDAANSLASVTGAKSLTLKQALVVGVIFESLGSFCGGSVISSIRKGIVDIADYEDSPDEFIWGMLSALLASTVWIFLATIVSMPVSVTHAVVGSMAGFGIVANSWSSIQWGKFGAIAASWVISPVTAAIITIVMYKSIEILVLERKDQARATLTWIPVYAFAIGVLLAWVTIEKGLKDIGLDISDLAVYLISGGVGVVVAIVNFFFVRRHVKNEAAFNSFEAFGAERALNTDVLMDVAHSASLAVRLGRRPNRNMLHGGMDRNSREFQEEAGYLGDDEVYLGIQKNMSTITPKAAKILSKHPHIIVASTAAAAAAASAMNSEADIRKLSMVTAAATTYAVTATANAMSAGILDLGDVSDENTDSNEIVRVSVTSTTSSQGDQLSDVPLEAPYEIDIDAEDIHVVGGVLSHASSGSHKHAHPATESIPDDVSSFIEVLEENKEELKDNVPVPVLKAFDTLMVLAAITQAFGHAANNIGNTLGPYVSILSTLETNTVESSVEVPLWTVIVCAFGLSAGLLLYGHKVIETVGSKIADLTSPTGFAVTFAASFTVVVASVLGFPISSTHVLVGAVCAIAFYRGGKPPDKKLLKNIALTWLVTCPAGAVLAAIFFVMFRAMLG